MAKITLNPTIQSLSGKIDGWVYRQQNGKTSVMPHRPRRKTKETVAQRKGRDRFRAAHTYASQVLADPLRRELYQKIGVTRNLPPNAVLISNFLTPPIIERIEKNAYDGQPGHTLQVLATDAIEVIGVSLQLLTPAGKVLESGPAIKDHGIWVYRTTTTLPQAQHCTWEVTARNRAGAEAKLSVQAI